MTTVHSGPCLIMEAKGQRKPEHPVWRIFGICQVKCNLKFWFQRCNSYGSFRDDVQLFIALFTPETSRIRKRVLIWCTKRYHCPQNFKITLLTMTQSFFFLYFLTLTNISVLQIQPLHNLSFEQTAHFMSTRSLLELKSGHWVGSEGEEEADMNTSSYDPIGWFDKQLSQVLRNTAKGDSLPPRNWGSTSWPGVCSESCAQRLCKWIHATTSFSLFSTQ